MSSIERTPIYCRSPIEVRRKQPLYLAVSKLVKEIADGKSLKILDIGCSDGPSACNLTEDGHNVVGVDINFASVHQSKENGFGVDFIQASATELPFPDNAFFDVSIALNLLEHLDPDKIQSFLQKLRTISDHQLIAVPVITPSSVFTLRDGLFAAGSLVRTGELPESGLFDRTHQLFWSMQQYEALFEQNDFNIKDRWIVNPYEGIQGDSFDIAKPEINPLKYCAYMMATRQLIPAILGFTDSTVSYDQRVANASAYLALYQLS